MSVERSRVRGVALPGVFRPRSDTWLLASAACRQSAPGRILEVCAGPAFSGVAAARHHGAHLTAVDISWRAVFNAWLNAHLNGVRVRALHGDLFEPVAGERFDLILANPPYLPGLPPPAAGPARAWEAGADGRAVLDRICAAAPAHLAPGGALLLVHSEVCGPEATLRAYSDQGLRAEVIAARRGPLGPLLHGRRQRLVAQGMLRHGQADEDVLVLRGSA